LLFLGKSGIDPEAVREKIRSQRVENRSIIRSRKAFIAHPQPVRGMFQAETTPQADRETGAIGSDLSNARKEIMSAAFRVDWFQAVDLLSCRLGAVYNSAAARAKSSNQDTPSVV
jgi:hypothetical protein